MERFWKFALGMAYIVGFAAVLGLLGMCALILYMI